MTKNKNSNFVVIIWIIVIIILTAIKATPAVCYTYKRYFEVQSALPFEKQMDSYFNNPDGMDINNIKY